MLTNKQKKIVIQIDDDLAMPKWKFILLYGLSFGLIMVVFSSLTDMLFNHVSFKELFRKRIWNYLTTAPIGGLFYGLMLRWIYIRQRKKIKAKESRP
ncbi:MAG TPA: hypothetical protein VN451_10865 [Chitinophagaceae bacterium]|nr:hypothetical protein [Chitinophagaceae bacterium]